MIKKVLMGLGIGTGVLLLVIAVLVIVFSHYIGVWVAATFG